VALIYIAVLDDGTGGLAVRHTSRAIPQFYQAERRILRYYASFPCGAILLMARIVSVLQQIGVR